MCIFQLKTGHILEMVRDMTSYYTKWHTPYQMRWKSLTLDDLEGHYALLWLNCAR